MIYTEKDTQRWIYIKQKGTLTKGNIYVGEHTKGKHMKRTYRWRYTRTGIYIDWK